MEPLKEPFKDPFKDPLGPLSGVFPKPSGRRPTPRLPREKAQALGLRAQAGLNTTKALLGDLTPNPKPLNPKLNPLNPKP